MPLTTLALTNILSIAICSLVRPMMAWATIVICFCISFLPIFEGLATLTTNLSPNSYGYGYLTNSSEVDSFQFTLSSASVENFVFNASNGSFAYSGWSYRISVYNSLNQLVGENFSYANTTFYPDSSNPYIPNFSLGLSADTYTVKIQAYSTLAFNYGINTGWGGYDIYLSQTGLAVSSYPSISNHSISAASLISIGNLYYGQLEYTSISDYYKINLNATGGEFIFTPPANNPGATFNVSILNSYGNSVYSITDSNVVDLCLTSLDAGNYYLKITGASGYDGNNYSVEAFNLAAPISEKVGSYITNPAGVVSIKSLFNLVATSNSPKYLDICMSDRNEYAHALTPDFGTFIGNGHIAPVYLKSVNTFFTSTYQNINESAIVFTYQASSGKYFNSIYGFLDDLNFVSGSLGNENAEISVFGTNNLSTLTNVDPITSSLLSLYDTQYLANLAANKGIAYYGSIDVVNALGSPPAYATPNLIGINAAKFVGLTWNDNGCWVLASEISALSGASLPATSLELGSTPINNSEWIVVYSAAHQSFPTLNQAESLLRPGDVVTVGWTGGGGHIFTVVSGYGLAAMTIDNSGLSANDGVTSDIVIQGAHSVSNMLALNHAIASSINIYRLDTPTITINVPSTSLAAGSGIYVNLLLSASDAGGAGTLAITKYAFYCAGTGSAQNDKFSIDGVLQTSHFSDNPLIVEAASISQVVLRAAVGAGGEDTVYVKAFNGIYWGDWSTFSVVESPDLGSVNTFLTNLEPLSVSSYFLSDSSSNIASAIDSLGANVSKIASITSSDSSAISLTLSQLASDASVFTKFTSTPNLVVTDTAAHFNNLDLTAYHGDRLDLVVTSLDGDMSLAGGAVTQLDLTNLANATYSIKTINSGADTQVNVTSGASTHAIVLHGELPNQLQISANYTAPITSLNAVGLSPDHSTLIMSFSDGTTTTLPYSAGSGSVALGGTTYQTSDITAHLTPQAVFANATGGANSYVMPTVFSGDPALHLQYQLISSEQNAVITGASSNDFIKLASTNSVGKAVNGGGGTDVIDGGVGSTFISGGIGHTGDTFFLDGRASGTSWSTITDFNLGSDMATIWGFVKGVSGINNSFNDANTGGAVGYTGLTLHFDNLLPDGQLTGSNPDLNSITFTSHLLSEIGASSITDLNNQIANATYNSGTDQYIVNSHMLIGQTHDGLGDHSYLFLH